MAIKYPDYLQNNNPNEVLIDATENQTKGFGFFYTTRQRDLLATALHTEGYLAIVGVGDDTNPLTAYVFQGGTWDDEDNWAELGGVGDGLQNVVEDLTPQLGGNLDVQSSSLFTSVTDGNVTITPNGTGYIDLDGSIHFKRFTSPPAAFDGGMYADDQNNLYFGINDD